MGCIISLMSNILSRNPARTVGPTSSPLNGSIFQEPLTTSLYLPHNEL